MELKNKLRMDFNNFIRPLKIKKYCEHCGCSENLELHHVQQFVFTMQEVLNDLGLEEKDHELYTVKELKMIRELMLGKQLKQDYLTLCTSCHDKIDVNKRYSDEIREKIKKVISNYAFGIDEFTTAKCYRPYKAVREIEKRLADWKSNTDNKTEDERFEDFEEIFIDLQQVFDLNPQFNMNKYLKKYPDRY